jgi:hypothetical protein
MRFESRVHYPAVNPERTRVPSDESGVTVVTSVLEKIRLRGPMMRSDDDEVR